MTTISEELHRQDAVIKLQGRQFVTFQGLLAILRPNANNFIRFSRYNAARLFFSSGANTRAPGRRFRAERRRHGHRPVLLATFPVPPVTEGARLLLGRPQPAPCQARWWSGKQQCLFQRLPGSVKSNTSSLCQVLLRCGQAQLRRGRWSSQRRRKVEHGQLHVRRVHAEPVHGALDRVAGRKTK